MSILATSNGAQRELIPSGNYIARCYEMIQIGTITEFIQGKQKTLHKVRIGWELPEEQRVFSQEKGEQPMVISKEYTLSMNEKSNLRKDLKSWRGKDFTEDEAKGFDITKLLGVPCLLNIIHKPSVTDPSKIYEQISGITAPPKRMKCPPAINPVRVLSYDNFDYELFNSLPDFIKTKIQGSAEYIAMKSPGHKSMDNDFDPEAVQTADVYEDDGLPF